jgi:TPP-dependent pyruvate/acetoin dehydrogenase alpha subunit
MTGHSAHDDAGYVPPELFEFWQERDPVNRFQRVLIDRGLITAAGIEEVRARVNGEIDEAIRLAENDPFPDPEDCLKDVYYEGE